VVLGNDNKSDRGVETQSCTRVCGLAAREIIRSANAREGGEREGTDIG